MYDSLCALVGAVEHSPAPVFSRQTIDWPASELAQYMAAGLLRETATPATAICPDCGERVDVHWPQRSAEEPRVFLSCGDCGPQSVPASDIACWRLDFTALLDQLVAAVGATGSREETVRGRVWRLGKARLAGATRSVYFARQLARHDAAQVVEDARFLAGAVVLVPKQIPPPYLQIQSLPRLVRLVDCALWEDGLLAVDLSHVNGQFAPAEPAKAEEQPTKRGPRLALIEALRHALLEHLRAARDHAFATRGATGTPALLPRPSQDMLARQLGVHRSTISRCLEDPSARQLQLLWEVAADLDRILGLGALHGSDVHQGPFDARAQGDF
jgi:hypothetical protein